MSLQKVFSTMPDKRPSLRQFAKSGLKLACLWAFAATAFAATPALSNSGSHLRIAHTEIGRTQHIQIGVNKSLIVDLPVDAGEVIVSQPGVANAIMRTKTRAVIQGISAGETNMLFLDARGQGIAVVEISVAQDSSGLAATINRLVPGARVQVQSFADAVVISGDVQSGDDREKAVAIAAQYVGGQENVTSLLNVAGGQQVALKVVVAEVKRETAHQLGINLAGSLTVGSVNLGLNRQSGFPETGGGYTGDYEGSNFSFDADLRALESRGALKLLAEPVLTAMSGEEATFHVGGEFPIPSTDSDGRTTYTYRDYGIALNFTPTVRSNGIIGLTIDTEVSELSDTTAGALNKRTATTSVELPAYQTLAIAGLMEERTRRQISELPGLGNIPILGALFRSHEYTTEQTELVILVTPMIAQANHTPPPTPVDTYAPASDAEAMFLGRMENLYGVSGAQAGGQFRGSVGFVLD